MIFKWGEITLHSGDKSNFKIECDELTDEDLEGFAAIVAKNCEFSCAFGVPTGGERFAEILNKYATPEAEYRLIADDVLTTGNSMEQFKKELGNAHKYIGVVIFARGKCPDWIKPIFQMTLN